ncbi:hypothetical protein ACVGVM_15595 [Pseudonocardia bannensis]|uniref:Uncharacterized protein n=1 Tax=Pseudonocardia bannensis TaxID=630973 RepID=A0A848DNM7_9PSEU|nr:hypothetical protein [Pseudonocardia bannensis]NMH94086.1 hypothetical protein [Pseudonocardia bannensis]
MRHSPTVVDVRRLAGALATATTALDTCDGYVVVVIDAVIGEADAYGPFTAAGACAEAERLRNEMGRGELGAVTVSVIGLHRPD